MNNMTEQIIRELALFLDPYKTTVLEEYQNNIYQDCPILTENDRLRINNANDRHIYEGQLLLKEIVSERVEGAVDNIELNSWIVRIWGGINRFNPYLRYGADNRVSLFFNALNNRNIPNRFIKSISSLSKIAVSL